MVSEVLASWAGRMDVTRVGWRADGWAKRMDAMRAGWMAVSWIQYTFG